MLGEICFTFSCDEGRPEPSDHLRIYSISPSAGPLITVTSVSSMSVMRVIGGSQMVLREHPTFFDVELNAGWKKSGVVNLALL